MRGQNTGLTQVFISEWNPSLTPLSHSSVESLFTNNRIFIIAQFSLQIIEYLGLLINGCYLY